MGEAVNNCAQFVRDEAKTSLCPPMKARIKNLLVWDAKDPTKTLTNNGPEDLMLISKHKKWKRAGQVGEEPRIRRGIYKADDGVGKAHLQHVRPRVRTIDKIPSCSTAL